MSSPGRGRTIAWLAAGAGVLILALLAFKLWRIAVERDQPLARDFEGLGWNIQGLSEYRHKQTGIVFVALPGGRFSMGSPPGEAGGTSAERPVHVVSLSPFLIAKFEVTQTQWERVVGFNPSKYHGDDLPVQRVSWIDCLEFCTKTGLEIPTEAQWEYACRAGTDGPCGGTEDLKEMGWYEDNSEGKLHPVGLKAPNAFGLYDMHGNVWEWCRDAFDANFYRWKDAAGPDPLCSLGDRRRVRRGGCFRSPASYCRSAYRRSSVASRRTEVRGFRPAFSL